MLAPAAHPPVSWRLCPEALVSRAAGPQQKKARAGAARGDQVSFLPSTPAPGAPHGLACTIPPASPPPQPSATQPSSGATLVLTIWGQASSLLRPHPRPGVRHRAGRVGWGPGARRCPEQPSSRWGRPELRRDCLPQFLPWASFLRSGRGLSVCYLISILSALLPGVWAAGKKHSPLSHAPRHILMN